MAKNSECKTITRTYNASRAARLAGVALADEGKKIWTLDLSKTIEGLETFSSVHRNNLRAQAHCAYRLRAAENLRKAADLLGITDSLETLNHYKRLQEEREAEENAQLQ